MHLALVSYSHFDGTTWHEEPCCNQTLPAELETPGSWLRLLWYPAPYLAGAVAHQVKIGTLESSPIPMPPHPVRFRVGSVNRLDFFGWAQRGIIRMTDRTVPAGTVIDTESLTVNPEGLRSLPFPARSSNEDDHHLSFQGEYAIDPAVAALARSWVAGLPEGWRQVEAVIEVLRREYVHDRSSTASPGTHRCRRRVPAADPPRTRLPVRRRGDRAPAIAGLSDPGRQRPVRGAGALRPPDAAHGGDWR